MQRRSFFRKLFGAVLAGFAAPRVGTSAAEPLVVIDPAAPFYKPMVGGRYAPDQPMFPVESIQDRFFQTSPLPEWFRQHAECAEPGDWI